MWDIIDAELRLEEGQSLFLYRPENKTLGYVWFEENLLYNAFMHSSHLPQNDFAGISAVSGSVHSR